MAGMGRLFVGGGAVLLGYTITNNALNKVTDLQEKVEQIHTFPPNQASESGRFSRRRLDERRRGKPGGKPATRQATLRSLSDGVLDVAVVGGNLEAASSALQLASRGLRVAIIDEGDFDSGLWQEFRGRQLVDFDVSGREWRLLDTAPHLATVGKQLIVPPSLPSLLLLYLTKRWKKG